MEVIYFTDIYPTVDAFQTAYDLHFKHDQANIFTQTKYRFTPLSVVYQYLLAEFVNVPLRYDTKTFVILFWTRYRENYFTLLIKQIAYIKEEYLKLTEKASRQSYMIHTPKGKSIMENFSAITNSGMIVDSESPFTLKSESLAHKEGTKNITSYEDKQTITTNADLYLNIMKIAGNVLKLGLTKFAGSFRDLGQLFYSRASFDQKTHVVNIEFDEDTMKKIKGKWRVIGIKDYHD